MRLARATIVLLVVAALALGTTPCFAPYIPYTPEYLVPRYQVIALFQVERGNITPDTVFQAPQGAPEDFDFHARPTVTLKAKEPLQGCQRDDGFEVRTPLEPSQGGPARMGPRPPVFLNDGDLVLGYLKPWQGNYVAHVTIVRDGKLEIEFSEERLTTAGAWGMRAYKEALPVTEALQVVAGAVRRWNEAQIGDLSGRTAAQLIDDFADNKWLNDRIIDELARRADATALNTLLGKAEETAKLQIARAMAKIPGPAPVPHLVDLLGAPEPALWSAAIEGLARPEAKPAVPALVDLLDRKAPADFVPLHIAQIAKTIAAIGDSGGIDAVLAAAAEPELSRHAAGVIDALAPLLPDPRVKAFMLARLHRPEVVLSGSVFEGDSAADIERSKRRYQQNIMFAAAKALAKSGSDAGSNRLVQMVREERKDEFPENMVVALGEVGDKRAVPLLLEMLAAAGVDYQWNVTAGALVRIRDERAVDPLINLVRRTNGETRAGLITIISEWDHPKIRAVLMAELRGNDRERMRAAARALHKYGVPEAADRLLEVLAAGLEGWQRWERYSLYMTLAEMREQRAIPGLLAAMTADKQNREEIANALGLITGADLPADPGAWTEWWRQEGSKSALP